MSEAHFIKLPSNVLIPAGESDKELLDKIKAGEVVKLTLTRVRNYQFHKKYFALLNIAFDYFDPDEGEKSFDQFREDIIILSGHYEQYVRLNGDIRTVAKSISFASMDEDTFEELYSATIDVILKYICTRYTGDELRSVVDSTMEFA